MLSFIIANHQHAGRQYLCLRLFYISPSSIS